MPTTTGRATDFITFSRASNATVVASDGKIKWAGHNILTNSETFDNAAWVKTSATVSANSDPAPDGTTTADTIAASGANGTALQAYTAAGFSMTFAVWLRRKTGTGTVEIAADSGTYTAVTITSSWALYTVTQTPASGSRNAGIRIVTSGDEVYAWGAHLYRSDLGGMVANPARGDSYYPTTSAAYYAPRLDYDPVTLAAKGLLVEELRTNLLTRSNELNNWLTVRASVTTNAAVSPDGTSSAEKIIEDNTASNSHFIYNTYTSAGGAYTFSVYAKAAERNWLLLYPGGSSTFVWFNLSTGTVGTAEANITASSITPVGNGWYRCTATATISSGAQAAQINIASANGTSNYTGDGSSGILVYGAQIEAGSFPTSLIVTGAASATRSADVASVATSQFPYSATEGTLVANATFFGLPVPGLINRSVVSLGDGTPFDNYAQIMWWESGNFGAFNVGSGGSSVALLGLGAIAQGATKKIAAAYKANDFAASMDGGSVVADTAGAVPSNVSSLYLGQIGANVFMFNGHIRQITYIPRRLTNAELQSRTA